MSQHPRLKKIGIVVGALFIVLIAVAAIIPMFIHVDDYRPKIVQAANEQLNGKLELGKLSLSLWGEVRIQVDGFKLSDLKGRKIVSAKDVYFQMPFTSVLLGSPKLTFRMLNPEVDVVKDRSGKMNVMTLMKTGPSAKGEPGKSTSFALPAIASRARFGIEMRHAAFFYKDEATGLTSQVKDLNAVLKDLSMSHPTEIEIWADLDTKMGKTLSVQGPARLTTVADPKFSGGKFEGAKITLKADMDAVEILVPELFEKKKGVAAHVEGQLKLSPNDLKIESFRGQFFNADVNVTGLVANLTGDPRLDVKIKSNDISLKPWSALVPMLKSYDLSGVVTLDAYAQGPMATLKYGANLQLKGLTAKAPTLKAEPRIDGNIKVSTDQVENASLTFKAPGNDLRISGKVVSFSKPRVDFQVASTGLDLDQLVDFPKPTKSSSSGASSAPASGSSGKGVAGVGPDYDALLAPLRANKMAVATQAVVRANINGIKAYGVKMSNIEGQMSLSDLALKIDKFRMGVFGGTIKSSGVVQMKPKTPTYHLNTDVASLDLKQAVTSQLELFKNTIVGTAFFKMDVSGASFNPDTAKSRLNGKGNLKVDKAAFASIDIGKMVTDGINKSIGNLGDRVPPLKGKTMAPPNSIESKYEVVTCDFSIANGVFSAPNFFAKAEANKGIDLKGNTTVGIKDYSLRANWEVIDTYNLTQLRNVSVDQNGVHVDHILAEGNGPVQFPVRVGGTLFSPSFNYGAVPEALIKVALNNVTHALESHVKAQVQQKAEEAAKNALGDIGKKLFGN